MSRYTTQNAFTLAEVLITLVIIGVIAAMTVPTVISQTNRHEYRSALKKSFSELSNALEKHYVRTGLKASDYSSADDLVNEVFKQNLKTLDTETNFTSEICSGSVFVTADGIMFCIQNFESNTSEGNLSYCDYNGNKPCVSSDVANIWIDVNGFKKPNLITDSSRKPKDIYQGQIYADKVLPYGDPTIEFIYEAKTSSPNSPQTTPASDPTSPSEPVTPTTPPEPTTPTEPTTPPEPTNPPSVEPDTDDYTPEDIPENPEELYDPNKWPSFLDFLRWLWNLLHRLFP